MKQLRQSAPKWIYPWRELDKISYGSWVAVVLTAGIFAVGLTFFRVRMPTYTAWAAPEADVVFVDQSSPEGRWLTQRARAEGPFPARFVPSEWEGGAELEYAMMQAVRYELESYTPAMKNLSESLPEPAKLAIYGEPLLPEREISVRSVEIPAKIRLVPVITPISGVTRDDLPDPLPEITGDLAPEVALESWRYLLRVDGNGRVLDCISMAGGAGIGPSPISNWLRGIEFSKATGDSDRWLALGVGFKNQTLSDGTDAD